LNFRLRTAFLAAPSYANGARSVLKAGDSRRHPRQTPRGPLSDAQRRHTPAGRYGNSARHSPHKAVPRRWQPMHFAGKSASPSTLSAVENTARLYARRVTQGRISAPNLVALAIERAKSRLRDAIMWAAHCSPTNFGRPRWSERSEAVSGLARRRDMAATFAPPILVAPAMERAKRSGPP
jgi:hypothetical protein